MIYAPASRCGDGCTAVSFARVSFTGLAIVIVLSFWLIVTGSMALEKTLSPMDQRTKSLNISRGGLLSFGLIRHSSAVLRNAHGVLQNVDEWLAVIRHCRQLRGDRRQYQSSVVTLVSRMLEAYLRTIGSGALFDDPLYDCLKVYFCSKSQRWFKRPVPKRHTGQT